MDFNWNWCAVGGANGGVKWAGVGLEFGQNVRVWLGSRGSVGVCG